MRALLFSLLMVFVTASIAHEHHRHHHHQGYYHYYDGHSYVYGPGYDYKAGWKHRFDGYYGDGFGNYWDLTCHQKHKQGHFFTKHHKHYYPDYRYPKFGHFGHHDAHSEYPQNAYEGDYAHLFRMKGSHHPRGFYRCYNREGLSIECYKQHKGRG
jgi:hypothetical protein